MRNASNIDYGGHEFLRLAEIVEKEGGEHVDELHMIRRIDIPKQMDGGSEQRGLESCGCQDAMLLALPYKRLIFAGDSESDQLVELGMTEPEDKQRAPELAFMAMEVDEKDTVMVVCAHDDAVGLWPRYVGQWEDGDDD